MRDEFKQFCTWKGRDLTDLSKEELIEAVMTLGKMYHDKIDETIRERKFLMSLRCYGRDRG